MDRINDICMKLSVLATAAAACMVGASYAISRHSIRRGTILLRSAAADDAVIPVSGTG